MKQYRITANINLITESEDAGAAKISALRILSLLAGELIDSFELIEVVEIAE